MIRIRALRRGAIAVAAVALFPAISGCSGFLSGSMVENVENPAAGNIGQAGSMLVRNAFVLGPAPDEKIPRGGRAAVYIALFNSGSGGEADALVRASAGKAAESVRISGGRVEVPPQQLVNVTLDEGKLVLRGLTRPLSGGESITLTLTFAESGTTTLDVPVLPRTGSYETLTPFPASPPSGQSPASSPTSTQTGRASPTASPTNSPAQE